MIWVRIMYAIKLISTKIGYYGYSELRPSKKTGSGSKQIRIRFFWIRIRPHFDLKKFTRSYFFVRYKSQNNRYVIGIDEDMVEDPDEVHPDPIF